MPKSNHTISVQVWSAPCFQCACGYYKMYERHCDVKNAMKRHIRFCDVAKEKDYLSKPIGDIDLYEDLAGKTINIVKK